MKPPLDVTVVLAPKIDAARSGLLIKDCTVLPGLNPQPVTFVRQAPPAGFEGSDADVTRGHP